MSYCFRVQGVCALSYEDVIGAHILQCETGAHLSGAWQVGHQHRLFVHGVSTRSVEVVFDGGEFTARLFSGACREDYLLALDMAAAVSRVSGQSIRSEEGVSFVPSELEKRYGRGWVDDHIRAIGKVILRMASSRRPEEPLVVEGPIRAFHIGPNAAKAITASGHSDLERAERMFGMMREVQYPSAPILEPRATVLPDSEQVVAAAFIEPEKSVVVQRTDVLAFMTDVPAHVPWIPAIDLLGPYVRFLDEWTVAIAPIPHEAWADLTAAASTMEVSPASNPEELTQHTWWSTQVTDAPTEVFQRPVARHDDTPDEEGVRRWWDVWRQRR
ncbi:MAG: hypothetical protein ACJAZO_002380 [Myxococcota bacterium]